jgi:hypothetical protein
MRRDNLGKKFLATLPPAVHAVLREDAQQYRSAHGGQVSINRALVNSLFVAVQKRLTAEQRAAVEAFLQRSS